MATLGFSVLKVSFGDRILSYFFKLAPLQCLFCPWTPTFWEVFKKIYIFIITRRPKHIGFDSDASLGKVGVKITLFTDNVKSLYCVSEQLSQQMGQKRLLCQSFPLLIFDWPLVLSRSIYTDFLWLRAQVQRQNSRRKKGRCTQLSVSWSRILKRETPNLILVWAIWFLSPKT